MKRALKLLWLLPVASLLIAAAPGQPAEELLRLGNEAFHNQQYKEALDWYQKAVERSLDPGLVAYNQALAFYHTGQFREAELHFRRCLEDADGTRRSQALYGMGNSLLMQANKIDAALLRKAIKCYQVCRQDGDLTPEFRAQVDHNLELARLLLIDALAKSPNDPQSQDGPDPKKNTQPGSNGKNGGTDSTEPDKFDPTKSPPQISDGNGSKNPGKQKFPVPGNPPVLLDEDKLMNIPAEDLAAYLNQLTERIWQQNQQAQAGNSGPLPGVKDW